MTRNDEETADGADADRYTEFAALYGLDRDLIDFAVFYLEGDYEPLPKAEQAPEVAGR